VCDKWLKDRKGRTLSGEEVSHYQRVVVSLKETMRLMNEIDQVIPRWPMECVLPSSFVQLNIFNS
jgi:hypothetical protein